MCIRDSSNLPFLIIDTSSAHFSISLRSCDVLITVFPSAFRASIKLRISTLDMGSTPDVGSSTVSYTHLDVYKRQALRDQLAAVLKELRRIDAGNSIDDELLDTIQMIASIMDGMRAVSYTHLLCCRIRFQTIMPDRMVEHRAELIMKRF